MQVVVKVQNFGYSQLPLSMHGLIYVVNSK